MHITISIKGTMYYTYSLFGWGDDGTLAYIITGNAKTKHNPIC